MKGKPMTTPFSSLQVIGVRYVGDRPAAGDERALDAYIAAGVYDAAGVPVTVAEPRFPESARTDDKETNLGLINGAIADAVAAARREDRALLMTGGNCTHITGILGGLQDAHGPELRVGLVWFDAHGDFNTPHTTITGSLGGMPVAVAAGLAFPRWREGSHIVAPLPTDRIVMVDVRNLDPAEDTLVRAVGIPVTAAADGFPGEPLGPAIDALVERCDAIYLHIDADILDERYTPDHSTKEPNGPDMAQVLAAVERVMATGKVIAYAVVSVYAGGPNREIDVASGKELVRGGLASWRRYGTPQLLQKN